MCNILFAFLYVFLCSCMYVSYGMCLFVCVCLSFCMYFFLDVCLSVCRSACIFLYVWFGVLNKHAYLREISRRRFITFYYSRKKMHLFYWGYKMIIFFACSSSSKQVIYSENVSCRTVWETDRFKRFDNYNGTNQFANLLKSLHGISKKKKM